MGKVWRPGWRGGCEEAEGLGTTRRDADCLRFGDAMADRRKDRPSGNDTRIEGRKTGQTGKEGGRREGEDREGNKTRSHEAIRSGKGNSARQRTPSGRARGHSSDCPRSGTLAGLRV